MMVLRTVMIMKMDDDDDDGDDFVNVCIKYA